MKKIIIMFGLMITTLYSQYTCYRVFPSSVVQIEPSIVRHQQNPQILFASAYTINNSVLSEGIYVSTNGGLNWTGSDVLPNPAGDAGDPGPIIDKNGVFIVTHQRSLPTGMYANFSTNMGSSWSGVSVIAQNDQDKGSPITDDATASLYYGRTYLAWTKFINPFPIVVSFTTNGGANWTSFVQVNSSFGSNRSYGPSMSIGTNGEVYVCWASIISSSPFNEDKIGFAVSTNGGINWSVNENAYDCNGIKTSQLSPWTIRANGYPLMDIDKSGGPRNGWLYIVTAEKNLAPAGSDPDVVMHRSTDAGQTWSAGIRVNQDTPNNGKIQFFPIIRVDEGGGLNVIYYDNRQASDSTVDVYISRSTDGGNSWFDYRVSDHRFKPKSPSGSPGNMGDNIGITSGNGKLYPVWMSDHSGVFQVWSAIIDYNTIGIKQISTEVPKNFTLRQNYPNPFNPATKIRFAIPANGENVSLSVFDITGNEVKMLIDQQMKPGEYEVDFDGTGLGSGVYFYILKAGSFIESKKMILVK